MDVDGFVRDYYEALRRGEPLDPYFHERPDVVKVGVFSRLVGGDPVAEALRDQTARTTDWTVESADLRTFDRGDHAHFVDAVRLAWTDSRADRRHDFDTRWTGLVEARDGEPLFVSMHVSAGAARERSERATEPGAAREQRGAERGEAPRDGAASDVSRGASGRATGSDGGGDGPHEAGDGGGA